MILSLGSNNKSNHNITTATAYTIANFLCTHCCKLNEDETIYFTTGEESADLPYPVLSNKYNYTVEEELGLWETILLSSPSLSLQSSGVIKQIAKVPGVSEISDYILWFQTNEIKTNRDTKVCAVYRRNDEISRTKAIQVYLILALEVPILHPPLIAEEDLQIDPPKQLNESVDHIIPSFAARRRYKLGSYHSKSNDANILVDVIDSPIAGRLSNCICVQSFGAVEGKDYPLEEYNRTTNRDELRYVSEVNNNGFRVKLISELLTSDDYLPTLVFGITEAGVQPNIPGVNSRNVWHSVLAVTEDINRPRIPKDYHYMLASKESIGSPEPSTFLIKLKGHEYFGLVLSSLNIYEEKYSSIKEKREVYARQIALDTKIEYTKMVLKSREKGIQDKYQLEIQRAMEKKLRKVTKSIKGWRQRFFMSTVLEIQGSWERRRDDRYGVVFFHKISDNQKYDIDNEDILDKASSLASEIEENFVETCQWEVPDNWIGDPLEGTDLGDNNQLLTPHSRQSNSRSALRSRNRAPSTTRSNRLESNRSHKDLSNRASTAGANRGIGTANGSEFIQPDEGWVPGKSVQFDGLTPGMVPKQSVHPRIDGSDMRDMFNQDFGDDLINDDSNYAKEITEKILVSDELTNLLAFRLGIPSNQLRPLSQLTDRNIQNPPNAPRIHDDEEDDDDYSSDDDEIKAVTQLGHQIGDTDNIQINELDIPESRKDITKRKILQSTNEETSKIQQKLQPQVPYLNFSASNIAQEDAHLTTDATNWRGLPTASVSAAFFSRFNQTKVLSNDNTTTQDPETGIRTTNSLNNPIYLTAISPVDACHYEPEGIKVEIESIFIPNIREELQRAMSTLDRNIKREEELSKNIATDDLLLFGQSSELTSNDKVVVKQYQDDNNFNLSPLEEAASKALSAAKSGDIATMENCLEENIDINLSDDNGNTLFILAAQQGLKKMCKYLLRHGANINSQNLSGNTALHYCFSYNHIELAEYLKSKGADDSILNADGLTCYESLRQNKLDDRFT
eukprot:gene18540-24260_t